MPAFIRSMLAQKSKPAFDYVKVILPLYVLVLLFFVAGMVIATIWR